MALTCGHVAFEGQKVVAIVDEGVEAGEHRLDLVMCNELVIELKAVKALEGIRFAQLRSNFKATGLRVGLLMNFNVPTLVVKYVVL